MRKLFSTVALISLSVLAAACSKKQEDAAVVAPDAMMNEAVQSETVTEDVNAVSAAPALDNASDANAMDSAANAVDTAAPSQNNGNPIGGR